MSDKLANTHITREDGVYFISTINRNSSAALTPDVRYAETMAWGPATAGNTVAWGDGRGPLVFECSSAEGSIRGHIYALQMIHKHGNSAQAMSDGGDDDE